MERKVVIINGYPEAGKDTFVQMCIDIACVNDIKTRNLHASDPAKSALRILGWDGEDKSPAIRGILAYIKRFSELMWDTTYKFVKEKLEYLNKYNIVVFIHIREPKLIQRLVEDFGAITIFVVGKNKPTKFTNYSDMNVENYQYDMYIDNTGSIDDLLSKADEFMTNLLKN